MIGWKLTTKVLLLASMVMGGSASGQFVMPTRALRAGAVGSLDGLSPGLRRAFTDGGEFQAKRPPSSGDWLAEHEEIRQNFRLYVNSNP
jgi:hypothetical protein